ncbi:MAG: hypothetical protein ABGZ53_32740, partial [Fuerstiella sp.]
RSPLARPSSQPNGGSLRPHVQRAMESILEYTRHLKNTIRYCTRDDDLTVDMGAFETSSISGNIDGDTDFDANDSFLIHLVKLAGTDAQLNQSKGSSSLTVDQLRTNISQLGSLADVDGDGDFDANDSFLIHLVNLSGTDTQIEQSKGGSSLTAAQIRTNINALHTQATTSSVTTQKSQVLQSVMAGISKNDVAENLFANVEAATDGLPIALADATSAEVATASV